MTSSNGNIFLITGPLWGEFTGQRWIPFTKAWIDVWVNNRDPGDLNSHRTHYDVTVMEFQTHTRNQLGLIFWANENYAYNI